MNNMNAKEEVLQILKYELMYGKIEKMDYYSDLITAVENAIFDVPSYDENLFINLWYERNPSHEINANTGKDMFFKTAFLVFLDFLNYKKTESDGK